MCPKSVLYVNDDRSVIVVDIPCSVAEAQGRAGTAELLSCSPLSEPYHDTEPKTSKAHRNVASHSENDGVEHEICRWLSVVLQHLQEFFRDQTFCLPRYVIDAGRTVGRKRKLHLSSAGDDNAGEYSHDPENELSRLLARLSETRSASSISQQMTSNPRFPEAGDLNDTAIDVTLGSISTALGSWQQYLNNASNEPLKLALRPIPIKTSETTHSFHIPPHSAYLLANCSDTTAFRAAARDFSPGPSPSKGRFDLILLDPPWPNRSATRKSSYKRSANSSSVSDLLFGLDLDVHVAPNGYIAIWVTNRPAFRELVLGHDGLFAAWNVALVEEWTWLKVTEKGEPVTPLDGMWRKPWETLLIGRAPSDRMMEARQLPDQEVKRRVVVGVPDLHSRKPCVKWLFEDLLLTDKGHGYVGLEVFARYLVSGWMSWGDEVLKYNWEGYWR